MNLQDLVFAKTPLDAALVAIDCGMWPVPILAGDGKKPMGENWKRQWPASEIRDAFLSHQANGIGLILGPGPAFPIIDIDLDSDQAIEAMSDLFGPNPEYTLAFRASRGMHWLYQWDDRLQVVESAVKHWPIGRSVAEQVEIRLGCGKSAQTVIPPSWHREARKCRSWLVPADGLIRIAKMPDAIIERLIKDFEKKKSVDTPPVALPFTEGFNHPYIVKSVEKIIAEVANSHEGNRNSSVNKAAFSMSSLMTAQNLEASSYLAAIVETGISVGLSRAESEAAVRSGSKAGQTQARQSQVLTANRRAKARPAANDDLGEPVFSDSILPKDEYSDLKFADIVIGSHGDKFKYCEPWKTWAAWDRSAGVWVQSQCRHHEWFKCFATGESEYLGSATKIRAAAALAMSDARIMATPDQFDGQPDYINLKNGVLDIITGQLLDHDPAFMATKQANASFDPSAKCPKFIATLEQVQPDPEIRLFLQRWLGTVLSGRTLAESVVNYGDGANGKSTILESVGLVLGSYFAKMPRGFIAKTKNERHPAELVTLYGARFALASETDISDALDEAKIKMILGDGAITARRMNENFWTFTPTHKFAIAANHMPSIVGQDSGIWRRLAFVPWTVTIPEEQRQPEYEKVLHQEESSGILNWLIEGYKQHQAIGLAIPDKIKAAGKDVQESSDWLGEFVGESLTTQPRPGCYAEDRIRSGQVYDAYKKWAAANGAVALASNKAIPLISKRLTAMGVVAKRIANVAWYCGLRLKDQNDHDNEADGDAGIF